MVGAWLVQALLDRGEPVVVLRRRGRVVSALTLIEAEPHCAVVRGDLADPNLLDRVFSEHDVDTVFHLAAQSLVGVSTVSPLRTFESNVRGTWLVLEACRAFRVRRVVVAASHRVYGPVPAVCREDSPLLASQPYDVSKAATDLIARSYWPTYAVPVATTRCANTYGGADLNFSRLVPSAVVEALSGRAPVVLSDGSPQRDFLYVEDAVQAYLAIADALDDPAGAARGQAFNVGGDRAYSVREVVDTVCRIARTDAAPDIRGTPTGIADVGHVDSSKLRELTGWTPRFDLEQGIRRTVAWYAEHAAVVSAAARDLSM